MRTECGVTYQANRHRPPAAGFCGRLRHQAMRAVVTACRLPVSASGDGLWSSGNPARFI
jgi:hypothetical protein